MGRRKKSEILENKKSNLTIIYDEDIRLTKAYNLKQEIAKEHCRAEFQRLTDGWVGCGCSICQEFYKTIDLTQFGDRVIKAYDTFMINKDPKRRDPEIKYAGEDDVN